jgi:hypothetical protein
MLKDNPFFSAMSDASLLIMTVAAGPASPDKEKAMDELLPDILSLRDCSLDLFLNSLYLHHMQRRAMWVTNFRNKYFVVPFQTTKPRIFYSMNIARLWLGYLGVVYYCGMFMLRCLLIYCGCIFSESLFSCIP